MKNIYSDPSDFGMTLVGEAELSDGSYQFDMTLVLTDGESFYYVQDSGCSCPMPFEDVTGIDGLTKIDRPQDLIDFMDEQIKQGYTYSESDAQRAQAEAGDLIRAYRDAAAKS